MLGWKRRALQLALAEIPIPKSPLVDAAHTALAASPAFIVGHSVRTYLWGALLAIRDGIRIEPEAAYLASLLHDLGLVHAQGADCFALRGANHARSVLVGAGAAEYLADRVADAISLHLNIGTTAHTPEARVVQTGAAFDVVGQRLNDVHLDTRREVVAAWSRDGFAVSFARRVELEAKHHSGTRIGFLCGSMGMPALIAEGDRNFLR
jgi:hypothetical protein